MWPVFCLWGDVNPAAAETQKVCVNGWANVEEEEEEEGMRRRKDEG